MTADKTTKNRTDNEQLSYHGVTVWCTVSW